MKKPASKNLFFHGMVEWANSERIRETLETKKNITYLRWPLPFKTFHLADMDDSLFASGVQIDDKEVFTLEKLFRSREAKANYIVIEDLHLLAHAGRDPDRFYRDLLAACNFHHACQSISFILSCAKVPAVFVRENALAPHWDFIDCNSFEPDSVFPDEASWYETFHQLRQKHPQLTRHHLLKLTGPTEDESFNARIQDAPTDALIRAMVASDDMFHSDVYVQDRTDWEAPDDNQVQQIGEHLQSIIIGQGEAIQKVTDATLLAYHSTSFHNHSRPKAIFLFVGPSGVGKTRICQELARVLPGYRFLQINLSEHNDRSAVNKLIGLGRGYEESEYGGILTEPVRLYPRHILLFDELDHAHPSVLRLFYKLFEGEIMDGRGRKVSFKDCFVIMTSNKGQCPGRIPHDQQRRAVEKALMEDGRRDAGDKSIFTEPFLGRIDSVVRFSELTPGALIRIARKYFSERIVQPLRESHGITLSFESTVQPGLMKNGVLSGEFAFLELWALLALQNPEQGARRLFQLMDEYLIKPLRLFSLKYQGSFTPGFQVSIVFTPFWPAVADYDQVSVLLIDDDKTEKEKLARILPGDTFDITWSDFDGNPDVSTTSVILLDLLKDGTLVWQDIFSRIQSDRPHVPVCIYSALPPGPHLDQLKNSLWEYGIFDNIEKNAPGENIRKQIVEAVRESYLMKKSLVPRKLKRLFLESPINFRPHEPCAEFVLKGTFE